jgi:hypothetical protein
MIINVRLTLLWQKRVPGRRQTAKCLYRVFHFDLAARSVSTCELLGLALLSSPTGARRVAPPLKEASLNLGVVGPCFGQLVGLSVGFPFVSDHDLAAKC